MKKILIMMFAVTLSLGASAQHKGFHAPRTRVYIAPSYSYGIGLGYPYFAYPYLGYPYAGYPYFGYGYPMYGSRPMPYKLNSQIQSIKTEYKYKIKAVRQDKSIPKMQRKQQILTLKSEREKDISTAEMNYHHPRINNRQGMNNQGQGMDNQNQGKDNQSQNQ